MPLLTPKRAIKAVFVISAVGFIVVDVSILLRDDDVPASTGAEVADASIRLKLSSAVSNLSGGVAGDNSLQRERHRLLQQMLHASHRNLTNTSRPTTPLPRVAHMGGNLSQIQAAMLAANRQQMISNLDMFDLTTSDSAVVIVVQVHDRSEYLRHLVSSLRKAVGIEQTLLVFSHDFYSDELNDIVASIDFCPVSNLLHYGILHMHAHTHAYSWLACNCCQHIFLSSPLITLATCCVTFTLHEVEIALNFLHWALCLVFNRYFRIHWVTLSLA